MTTNTLLFLLLSLIIAGGLSFYQYLYKAKNKSKVTLFLAFLRFVSLFGILLLLINPIISTKTFETIKTPLPIVVDNSSSIVDLKATAVALELYKKLSENSDLKDKFDVESYSFDSEFENASTFTFKGTQTNLDEVAKNLKSIHKNTTYPTVLITDGNQTTGEDYVYGFDANNKVFPLILGDTTTFLDLKVNQLNVNKYAFHKNKFPVEVFLQYSGTKNVNADFSISQGNSVLSKQSISFSSSKKSAIVNVLLPADKVGLQIFKASISSKEQEKNTYNNSKNFAVEVIDQKTSIAIVSAINHPDIGALKRAIESNAQRKVSIVKPNEIKSLQDYNVLILYQPTAEFKSVFENNKNAGINTFIITGINTDFSFLNQQQNSLAFRMSNQREDYLSGYNPQFNLFASEDLGFEQLPPLQNAFGTVTTNDAVSVLLSSKIRNIDTNAPLLSFVENQGKRSAFLLGENSWKWRMQSYLDHQSFEKYDIFINKIIQFLASNDTKKSLVVNHESFYNSGDAIEISAQYFNKNYEFDEKARLTIAVTNKKTKAVKRYDLLKTNNAFKVNLDGLSAGQYTFVVKELNSNTGYNGYFEILDFDIEKQFVNPDVAKLTQLATQTQGKVYYPNQMEELIKSLLENENYKAIQKTIVKRTPLIDWIWLLILIAITLASEWFIRKYNGLL
jgi:thiamine kinase-like enzyme